MAPSPNISTLLRRVFEKGKHLFGLDRAANAIRKDDRAVVVEGISM